MTKQEKLQHDFLMLTDRRSLYTQLKNLVTRAQDVANEKLQARRLELKKKLEYEDKIYEEEFVNKVKSRIDEDIKARKETLLKIKEANDKSSGAFLENKRMQQYMNSCYVVREALRRKELKNARECLLEQIAEKERAVAREKELDKFWMNVMNTNAELENQRHRNEECLRKKVVMRSHRMLEAQLVEKEEQLAEERKLKQAEIDHVAKVVEELRLEDFDRKMTKLSPKVLQYRNELLADVEQRRCARLAQREEEADEHRKLIAEVQRLDAEEKVLALEKKHAAHHATLDYIAYVKRMKQLTQQQQDMRDGRIVELGRIDMCTKKNIQQEIQRKAEVAAASNAILRRQVCEQLERRMREELERREEKITKNPFGRANESREKIWEKRMQMRRGLDEQIAEMNRLRGLEEEKYAAELVRARDDQAFCEELNKRVIDEGLDYLPTHPDWKILLCPSECCDYVPKAPRPYPLCSELPGGLAPEPLLCGCVKRHLQQTCAEKRLNRGAGGSGDK